MIPTSGKRMRWLSALGGVALVGVTSGCSAMLAASGIASLQEIHQPQTRAEVRKAFGEPKKTRPCRGARIVEHQAIPVRIPWVCYPDCVTLVGWYLETLGLFDIFILPVVAYQKEQAKLHYGFAYGPDYRVLYRYDLTTSPDQRFLQAAPVITDYWSGDSLSVAGQARMGECTSREGCVAAYAAEVRHRAACVGYPLTSQDEETLQMMQALAAEVDAGRLAPDETLEELKWCLGSIPYSCLRR